MIAARRAPGFEDESEAYALFRRAIWFLDRGHPGQAAHLLERALALEPGRNSIREALGRALFGLGRTESAAEQFGAIVAEVPDNDYAQYALGRCLARLGRAGRGARQVQRWRPRSTRSRVALYREATERASPTDASPASPWRHGEEELDAHLRSADGCRTGPPPA